MSRAAAASVVAVLGIAVLAILLVEPARAPDGVGGDATKPTSTTAGPTRDEPPLGASGAWERGAAAAFAPLGEVVPDLLRTADEWRAGRQPDDALLRALDEAAPVLERVTHDVDALGPLPDQPLVQPLMATSAELYVLVADVQRAALKIDAGPLREQVDLLARRARVLADRTFDRARAVLDGEVQTDVDPNIRLSLPDEVPDWAAERLAAGPPLAGEPTTPTELYPQRVGTRPTQPEVAWRAAVEAAAAPSGAAIAGALRGGDPAVLGNLADELVVAVEALRATADPSGAGGRERFARLRLGLLLRADAARAGQAAAVADGSAGEELQAAAERLLAAGTARALSGEDGAAS